MHVTLNILTLASLYIFEVTCFIRKFCQSWEQNSQVHKYNTWRKLDIHEKKKKTEIYKKSVINMGTKVYNNLPKFSKEIDDYKVFKEELPVICIWLVIIQNINSQFYVDLFVVYYFVGFIK
jgi:hypothetical protein